MIINHCLLVFLQNAWSPHYAGQVWPRESWLRALARSRSGQRLRVMLDTFEPCENTTPKVGATPDSILPPDERHIRDLIERRKPTLIVACGKQAETSLSKLWGGPLIAVPHPAHRLLTDQLYREARFLLVCGFDGRIALRQGRGMVTRETLSDRGALQNA